MYYAEPVDRRQAVLQFLGGIISEKKAADRN
jgi:hypothetical protein